MRSHHRIQILLLSLAILPLSGCVRSSRPVTVHMSTNVLKDATLDQLVETINSDADRLQSFIATVDIDFSAGGKKKGLVTDYTAVTGSILMRKPEMLRMKVVVPVVRNTLLDMVTNGKTFQASVPPKNQFWVGSSKVGKSSGQPLDDLRPQVILDALLLRPIDRDTETAVLEQGMEMVKDRKTHKTAEQPNYMVVVIRQEGKTSVLSRKIVFSREDLRPHEQYIYDQEGQLVTYARYDNVVDHDGILFPGVIDIQRPVEEYAFRLSIARLRLNEQLQEDQFVLPQPPGSKLINVDEQASGVESQSALHKQLPGKQ